MPEIEMIPVEKIRLTVHDLRLHDDETEIDELAENIGRIGMLVPILVAADGEWFKLVSGHRRMRAAKKLGLKEVPAIVLTDSMEGRIEKSFSENFYRRDFTPIELAAAIKDVAERGGVEIGKIAKMLHRTEHWVRQMIAVNNWPDEVLYEVHKGNISLSAARNLAEVQDTTYREFLVRNASEQGATARVTSAWLQGWRNMQPAEQAVKAEPAAGQPAQVPIVPNAPCIICSETFPMDRVSHVPVCGECVKTIRSIVY